jgi:nitroreductase
VTGVQTCALPIYDELLEFLKSRRTIRAIRPEPLPEDVVEKLLEVARWAPTGFNMQFADLMVLRDGDLRRRVKQVVDEWAEHDFYALEATRESWQGEPWRLERQGPLKIPLAPVFILILGDTRRRLGLPMNARYEKAKGDSIFESSLADVFVYLLLGAHSLGLAAQPGSAVKNGRVQGLLKHMLGLPISSSSTRCWWWVCPLWTYLHLPSSCVTWTRWSTTTGFVRAASWTMRPCKDRSASFARVMWPAIRMQPR